MDETRQVRQYQFFALVLGAMLIYGAWSAVFVPGGEYATTSGVWLDIGLDAGMTVLLPFLLVQILNKADPGGLKTVALVVGSLGVVGGLIQLAARFSDNRGWWTGHFS